MLTTPCWSDGKLEQLMVPSGKGTEGLFQRGRLAVVAPVLVCTWGAADDKVSSRLVAVELAFEKASGMPALAVLIAARAAVEADAVVVETSYD
jgi:hypothetical protein